VDGDRLAALPPRDELARPVPRRFAQVIELELAQATLKTGAGMRIGHGASSASQVETDLLRGGDRPLLEAAMLGPATSYSRVDSMT
jgi:hypothetical protein